MSEDAPTWSLYVIRCGDDSLYCGITTDVERRFTEHSEDGKKTAKYLRGRGPLKLVLQQEVGDKPAALKAELRFKKLPKEDKEAVVACGMLPGDQGG